MKEEPTLYPKYIDIFTGKFMEELKEPHNKITDTESIMQSPSFMSKNVPLNLKEISSTLIDYEKIEKILWEKLLEGYITEEKVAVELSNIKKAPLVVSLKLEEITSEDCVGAKLFSSCEPKKTNDKLAHTMNPLKFLSWKVKGPLPSKATLIKIQKEWDLIKLRTVPKIPRRLSINEKQLNCFLVESKIGCRSHSRKFMKRNLVQRSTSAFETLKSFPFAF